MLLINGYTSRIASFIGILPKPKKDYWAPDKSAVFFVLKDFNVWHIDPDATMLSSCKRRYKDGFDFAKKNLSELRTHILISGNRLQIVAHSHGVAFAEGIAAFLYEEDRFVTDLLIAIQGTQLAELVQTKNAVACRIDFKTEGDYIANRSHQKLPFANAEIIETSLNTNFIRYRIVQNCINGLPGAEYIYLRGNIPFYRTHMAHRKRQFEVWTAINHALALCKREPDTKNLFGIKHLQPEVLKQFVDNQN